jgi:FkbM family methyltransferase
MPDSQPFRLASRLLRKTASLTTVAANKLYTPPPPQVSQKEAALSRWLAVDGDKTLRLDYPLSRDSVVFDVGGFEGQWASDMFSRHLCKIHVFEPVPAFADRISLRFSQNEWIKVHRFALGSTDGNARLNIDGDASSIIQFGTEQIVIAQKTPEHVMEAERIDEVAVMKLNIEGAEYDLLEHLIATGLVRKIVNIQVQFHDFVPDAVRRMNELKLRLSKSHQPMWQYEFIWEGWTRQT